VSNASVVTNASQGKVEAGPIAPQTYAAAIPAQMIEANGERVLREHTIEGVGPLDEGHGAFGHLEQHAKLLIVDAAQPIGVDVADGQPALVALGNGERRAGHSVHHAERARGGPHERGLAYADFPPQHDDVIGSKERRDSPRQLRGFIG